MRGLIASFSASVCVAVTVVVLAMPAHGQTAEVVSGAKQIDSRAMQQVCESSAAVNMGPQGSFQCTVCPSYTDFYGLRQSFDLRGVYQGHFSTTNAEQLLLVMDGCESHASGLGGSILFNREETTWKRSGYFKGTRPSRCLSFKTRDGLDRLVCLSGDMHFGTFTSWISALSYKDNSLREERLLEGVGGNTAGGSPEAGYCYEQNIARFDKLPSDTGFMAVVTQARGLGPPGEQSCGDTEIRMEPAQTVNLNFQFDGEHFALAPESHAGMQEIENFVPHR